MYTTPGLNPYALAGATNSAAQAMQGPGTADVVANELQDFFEGAAKFDMTDVAAKLEAHVKKGVIELGKRLIDDHKSEKGGVLAHTFHGFEAAMKAAFPGWPEDTQEYYRFIGQVFFREGGGVILGNEATVRAAFKRFTDVLWPQQQVPQNRFWPLLKTLAEGVKYCRADYADRKYKVEVGGVIKRRGEVFDSKKLYDQKIAGRYVSGGVAPSDDEMKCRCLWVMVWPDGGEPTIYSHIGKLGRFHHSSFRAGEAIMAGGEWVIENGRLTHINACSGHYKPESWRFLTACTYLKNKGVITPETQMEVWNRDKQRELVPCLPFLKDFTRKMQDGYKLYKA